ncbi:MAG TPA: DUF4350 domain-containing protein [Galbitalea sp.]|jgi:hypothetical protein|nr:DUF4350 domain-containing protein [Galbitalea sp.]
MTVLIDEPDQVVTTPTVRRVFARARFWIVLAVFVAVVVVGYNLLAPPSLSVQPLDPAGTGQTGSRALVAVLGQHGVKVTATSTLAATHGAIDSPKDTTLLVYDPSDYLDSDQLAALRSLAEHVVVIAPDKQQVREIDPAVSLIGSATASPTAGCTLPAAVKAATLADGGNAYRVSGGAVAYSRCFPNGDNDYTLVVQRTGKRTLAIVGAMNAFTNRYIPDQGNAALAINLLGESRNLVWYLPSVDDVGASGHTVSFAEAAPAWITSFVALVFLVIIAAALWRGRRFGPLVIERMPVVVRASETMEGRARLYQTTSARSRALDSLRIGTIGRVTTMCGLPRTANLDEVTAAVASATGRPLADVRDALVERMPLTDSELVRQSDALLGLERDVAGATGHPTPPVSTPKKERKTR